MTVATKEKLWILLGDVSASWSELGISPIVAFRYSGASQGRHGSHLDIDMKLPAIGAHGTVETWGTTGKQRREASHGFELASTAEMVFGVRQGPVEDLYSSTVSMYSDLSDLCTDRHLHLVRTWNTIPHIHQRVGPIDNYMSFCKARASTLEGRQGPDYLRRLCAATVVGTDSDTQVLVFLASTDPGEPRQNPRQVNPSMYPRVYGPRSPLFVRAMRSPAAMGGRVLVSGTASIVGHETQHFGDVSAQAVETLENIRVVLDGAQPYAFRVYLRNASDMTAVRSVLDRAGMKKIPTLFVQAAICREDLLVEIEAVSDSLAKD